MAYNKKYLYGCSVWVQWYTKRVPRFELFDYTGQNKGRGVYYFRSRTEDTLLIKTFAELQSPGFGPFLIDLRKLEKCVDNVTQMR